MSEHTKEPWQIMRGPNSFDISGEDEIPIAVMVADDDVNARRIVACVNAFAGYSTEDVEDHGASIVSAQFNFKAHCDELLAELKSARRAIRAIKREQGRYDHGRELCIKADKRATAAIAKAEAA